MERLHKFLRFSVVLLFAIIFLASCSKNDAKKGNIKLTEEQEKWEEITLKKHSKE